MVRVRRKNKWLARTTLREFVSGKWDIYPPVAQEICLAMTAAADGGPKTPWRTTPSAEVISLGIGSALDPKSIPIVNGTAFVPIRGVIVPRASAEDDWYEQVGCDAIVAATANAIANESVNRIVALIDSPGGSALHLEETAQEIMALRGKKPMLAYCDGMMASAAYYIGSAFGPIYAGPSSMIGSIGCIYWHVSLQGMLEEWGIKVTPVHLGKHKADGSPYADLNEQSKATLQEWVDAYGGQFVNAVARHRGVTPKQVSEGYGQAKVFIAEKALSMGMIEGIASLKTILSATPNRPIGASSPWEFDLRNGGQVTFPASAQITLLNTSSASAPAAQGASIAGAPTIGGRTRMSPKIKAALFALGLIAAIDASDEVCQAALNGYAAARNKDVPKDEKETLDMLTGKADVAVIAASAAPLKPVEGQKPTDKAFDGATAIQIRNEVESVASLINSGREKPLISDEQIRTATDAVMTGAKTLAQVQSDWKKSVEADPERKPVTFNGSSEDAFVNSCVDVLLTRCGHAPVKEPPRDMRNMSLMDMGLRCASMTGLRLYGETKEAQAKELLSICPSEKPLASTSYNRPGDFPNLLSLLSGKILDDSIALADASYSQWTNRLADVADFKPKTVLGVGVFDNLSQIADAEDPPQLKFTEELKGFIQTDQFANKVGMTPRMVVDDDLDGFEQQLRSLMQAHEFKLNSLCVNILVTNPNLPDGVALFHATHKNLIATAPGIPSAAEASKVKTMMRSQTGIGSNRTIQVAPQVVLTGYNQEDAAQTTYWSIAELVRMAGGESKIAATDGNINIHRGKTKVICEPDLDSLISTTVWFAFDLRFRTVCHVFQTGFGRGGQRTNWADPATGVRWIKLEGRFGAAAVGHRGSLKDPGA